MPTIIIERVKEEKLPLKQGSFEKAIFTIEGSGEVKGNKIVVKKQKIVAIKIK